MSTWDSIQQEALSQLQQRIDGGSRRVCMAGPTGCGKSRMMSLQILREPKSAVYTHRRILLDQLGEVLESHDIQHGVRASGHKPRLLDDTQLCMLQSERVSSRDVHECNQYHVDEIHCNTGKTVLDLIGDHDRDGSVGIFWTATPLGIGHICDDMVVVASTSELRSCGALVPALYYGPDEPDTKWVGTVDISDGECGLKQSSRSMFAKRVFGRVLENYKILNKEQAPTVLFAPGVNESLWFAERLCAAGIPAAHIDGQNVWVDGQEMESTKDLRDEIRDRSEAGDIKVVCNRIVLREGIDWPWLSHGILATVFGSLTSYIQACGRLLRAYPGKERCCIQDHGGNWWRHGSVNSDWRWQLGDTNAAKAGERKRRLREKRESEPIACPKCSVVREKGKTCPVCGHRITMQSRRVLQRDGSLREMRGDIYRKPRRAEFSERQQKGWESRVRAICRSKKETVKWMTAAQLEVSFARDHRWVYPPVGCRYMPTEDADWYRPLRSLYPELVPAEQGELVRPL